MTDTQRSLYDLPLIEQLLDRYRLTGDAIFTWASSEIRRLRAIEETLDHFTDGPPILSAGPCFAPDGRMAFVAPRERPIAIIKGEDGGDDEVFDATKCSSSPGSTA